MLINLFFSLFRL